MASNRSNGEAFAKQQYASFVAVDGLLVVGTNCFTKSIISEAFTSNLYWKKALNASHWPRASLQGESFTEENLRVHNSQHSRYLQIACFPESGLGRLFILITKQPV